MGPVKQRSAAAGWTTWQISTGTAHVVPDPGDPTRSVLYVNGVPSSPLHAAPAGDVLDLGFEYLQVMAAVVDSPLAGAPHAPVAAVHLGGGACALARHVAAARPRSRQVVVEVDALLAQKVREVVDLPRSPWLRLSVGDARERLSGRPDASADVVVRDAFAGDTVPGHLTTSAFVADVARVLGAAGLYLANVVDRTGAPAGAPLRSELATALAVFGGPGHVAVIGEGAVLRGRRYGNAVLVASPAPLVVPAGLERLLRVGPAPARWVDGAELAALAAGGRVLEEG